MQSYEFQKLQHAIAAIRKERLPRNVKCDIIGSYDDFLREKDNLKTHYHFSLPVFNALVKLAGELLDSGRRFGRVELLNTMQQYLKRGNHKLDETAKTNLFGLFKKILDDNNMSYLAGICFLMLQDFSLSAEYEAWLCEKMEHYATEYYTPTSEMLFRRILNHPATSTTITKWVSENFNHPIFRFQRYKAIAWLLNENSDYVVDDQTLIDDFEFINRQDANMIRNGDDTPWTFADHRSYKRYQIEQNVSFVLHSRPYCSVICKDMKQGEAPDFTELRKFFTENLPDIKCQTMLWAVTWSKLPANTKIKLLKKYYSPFCFWTLLNIGKRYKLLAILEWLKKQTLPESRFCEIEIGKKLLPEKATELLMIGDKKM